MKIEIAFKNGSKLEITCEEFNITTSQTGKLEGLDFKGIKDNKPLYIDFNEILYIDRKI